MEIILCVLISVVSVSAALFFRHREKNTLNKIRNMISAAKAGDFHESNFDESILSSVESEFRDYLLSSGVTEAKIAEEKDRIKELISDISHQTKTPIANILLYTQLLSEQDLPESAETCVSALEAQTEKLKFLIDALIKCSRLENGILSLNPVKSQIMPCVKEAVSGLKEKADNKNIDIKISASNLSAVFDFKWTVEALGNILDNGIKYSPENSSIKISVRSYELFCRIDIEDEGNGIAEEDINKIFSRFYRSPEHSKTEGLGIGLYLTRQIISAQGGYIKVESKKGHGSKFSVFLPNA